MSKKELYLKLVNPDARPEEIEAKFNEVNDEKQIDEPQPTTSPLLAALRSE